MYGAGEGGAVKVIVWHGSLRMTKNVYPPSLVVVVSSSTEVTIKDCPVPCNEVSLVDIVTIRPDTDIHA